MAAMTNVNQSEKKDILRGVFSRAADGYARIPYFPAFGRQLVDFAQIPVGAKVLDVACGRGAALFPAAEKVGLEGQVLGIDLSDGMAKETNAEIQKRGIHNAEARQMDAENLQFPNATFDYVLCGFSLQFFPQLERALMEFHRVIKPGGRVAISTWGRDDPRWDWYEDLIDRYEARARLGTNNLDEPAKIQAWLSRAGFSDIHITVKEKDVVYGDEEEYWNMRYSISGRAGIENLEPAKRERLKADVFEKMQTIRQADGFHDQLEAYFTTAIRPV